MTKIINPQQNNQTQNIVSAMMQMKNNVDTLINIIKSQQVKLTQLEKKVNELETKINK